MSLKADVYDATPPAYMHISSPPVSLGRRTLISGRRRLEARAKRARTQIGKFFTCVSFLFLRRWASRCRRRSNVCSLVQEVVAWSHVGRCALCGLPVACVPGRLPPGKVRLAGWLQWEGLLGALHEWAWFFRARSRPSKVRSCLDSELWLCGRVLGEDWRVRLAIWRPVCVVCARVIIMVLCRVWACSIVGCGVQSVYNVVLCAAELGIGCVALKPYWRGCWGR